MIGYQMMADSYRKLLEQKRDTFTESEIKEFEREIDTYDYLGRKPEDEKYFLFKTGLFNDIALSYCKKAMENTGIPAEQVSEVLSELHYLFDTRSAKEITNE